MSKKLEEINEAVKIAISSVEESIRTGGIVFLDDPSKATIVALVTIMELEASASSMTDTNRGFDFWGLTEDGDDWRIEVRISEPRHKKCQMAPTDHVLANVDPQECLDLYSGDVERLHDLAFKLAAQRADLRDHLEEMQAMTET